MSEPTGYLFFGMSYWVALEYGPAPAVGFFCFGILLAWLLLLKKGGQKAPRLFQQTGDVDRGSNQH